MVRTMTAVILGVLLAAASAAGGPGDAQADRFAEANALFDRSVGMIGKDDRAASAGLRHAGESYRAILLETPSSDLATNAGNAFLLAGDTGRAIAMYHRALRLDPGDARARTNLGVARERAQASAVIETDSSLLERAVGWRHGMSPPVRALLAAGAWALLWAWAAGRVLGLWRVPWTAGAAPAALVAGVFALTIAADELSARGPAVGVVVSNETVGRTGPDAVVYDPSFTAALPEGVEFVVVDRRAGWVLGRLGDGRESWLRASDVQVVGGEIPHAGAS